MRKSLSRGIFAAALITTGTLMASNARAMSIGTAEGIRTTADGLNDVVALAKVAAASLEDAAVTPRYVVGLAAEGELPIVGRIALGSLKNKILCLLPAALLLSAFAAWAITPLLMIGGVFLCFEGYEKVHQMVPHGPVDLIIL